MKLTEAQEKAYNKIKEYINFAKECKTFKEYEIRQDTDHAKNRPDYEELVKWSTEKYEKDEQYYEEHYKQYWLDARENNIALTSNVSSSTLRALEKKGLIRIIEDGRNYVDRVQLIDGE